MVSSHDYFADKRNDKVKIYINGKFYKRKDAKISVFDSSVLLGDGVWDSLRYHENKFIFLLTKLFNFSLFVYGFKIPIIVCPSFIKDSLS